MTYFLGLDGGGSKTEAIVVDEDLQILGEGRAGPSNHLRVGIDEATREVKRAIVEATTSAGIQLGQIDFGYCGIAGSDHPKHRATMVEAVRRFFPHGRFTVDSDARIALTGAVGFGPGVVVISGTGSVAFGRNESDAEARAGGWGPTLGDEGSAYSIARKGLVAVARALDGRGPTTLMSDILCTHYGVCDPAELTYMVYAPNIHADDIALYLRLVVEAARQDDAVAKEILKAEAAELANAVIAVVRNLKMFEQEFPLAYVGGAFKAGDLLLDPFSAFVLEKVPGAKIQPPREKPVYGAARLAIRNARHPRVR
jgi:N-acetylglucosamine kinase-like BadF-type ATPase